MAQYVVGEDLPRLAKPYTHVGHRRSINVLREFELDVSAEGCQTI